MALAKGVAHAILSEGVGDPGVGAGLLVQGLDGEGVDRVLELTHNWGTESDDSQYHNGNKDPRGFGHICFSVPDIEAACARFDRLQIPFVKRLDKGMKHVAFISDPDGYWIEIVQADLLADLGQ